MQEEQDKKEYAYKLKIIEGKAGNPLIIVEFRDDCKNYWSSSHSWCPTLAELEFLIKLKKMMENSA